MCFHNNLNLTKAPIINSNLFDNHYYISDCIYILRFYNLVDIHKRMFPLLEVDPEDELKKYEYYANELRPLVVETVGYLHSALKEGKRILVEGANAAMLDIDFGNNINF